MIRWTKFALVGVGAGLVLAACQSSAEPQEAELGTGAAFVDTVEVEERDGEYWAVIEGFYPDAYSVYGGSKQVAQGDTIELTVTSTRPEDAMCAQVLTEMTEEILLFTDGFAPGEYTVIVNEGAMTTFTIT